MILIIIISVFYNLFATSAQNVTNYVVPEVAVQALQPNGFRIYIPWDPRIKLFHFEANFYDYHKKYYKSIKEFIVKETNGNLMYEDRETTLKVGDTVVYYIFVNLKKGIIDKSRCHLSVSGYTGQGQRLITSICKSSEYAECIIISNYYLEEDIIDNPDTPVYSETCKKTVTTVLNSKACSGQTIFEDNFETLRKELWQIEQYIPKDHPYLPFVSYQNILSNPTVFVKDGLLIIEPKLQQNMPGFKNNSLYGELNLTDGCTGRTCIDTNLLPPIVSGKLTAKIAFTYGTVEIRAKMPIGDWLYPELQFESLTNKYGKFNYASGVIKIASIFGNKEMNDTLYSNKFLDGGVVMTTRCPLRSIRKKIANGTWSDDFHIYSVKWTPDYIEFYVDGQMWSRLHPGRRGLRSWLPLNCRKGWYEQLGKGGNMAPFDHHFHLTLSVAAGGMLFPDSPKGTGAKPWRNNARKAILHFWKDLPNWYPTWSQPLLIDYVKIVAL